MTETFFAQQDTFKAEILLYRLPEWRISQLRRLFRLMFSTPWENEEALQELETEIPPRIAKAELAYKTAQAKYKSEFIPNVPVKSRDPIEIEFRKKNRELIQEVNAAKTQLDRWTKIKSIFEGEKNR